LIPVDPGFLEAFEERLDPARPVRPSTGATIIGYGEISTVLAVTGRDDVIVKRMAGFRTQGEVEAYCELVEEYCTLLRQRGVEVVATACQPIASRRNGRSVYLIQPRLPAAAIGNAILGQARGDDVKPLIQAVLERLAPVWAANAEADRPQVGLDGQISNWAWIDGDPRSCRPVYLDVGTPLVRRGGQEAMDPELALRAMPAPMAWVVRRFLLQRVLDRYHELRSVVKDLVANFIKEGRADCLPVALEQINAWLTGPMAPHGLAPLSEAEVQSDYAFDARMWTYFQACRRTDRWLKTRLLRRRYEYILPEAIRR
jgi:hypothetical protein